MYLYINKLLNIKNINIMKTIFATMIAFDKNSSANYSENLVVSSKEQANKQFKNFESNVPFLKWYYEVILDCEETEEVKEILSDIDFA